MTTAPAPATPCLPEPAWNCPVCGCTPAVPHPPPAGPVSVPLAWLAGHHQQPGLRVADIAAAAGISPRRLQALCKQHFGCSPMRLLAGIRMHHAHLALTGRAPAPASIAEAARLAGINRVSRFRAAYRSRYGTPPAIMSPDPPSGRAAAIPSGGPEPGRRQHTPGADSTLSGTGDADGRAGAAARLTGHELAEDSDDLAGPYLSSGTWTLVRKQDLACVLEGLRNLGSRTCVPDPGLRRVARLGDALMRLSAAAED